MKRNLFIRIPVACLFGIITTVVVAWGCALWVEIPKTIFQQIESPTRSYDGLETKGKSPGACRVLWQPWDFYTSFYSPEEVPRPYFKPLIDYLGGKNQFESWTIPTFERGNDMSTIVFNSRGWPFLAMYGGFTIDSPDGRGLIDKTYYAFILDFRPQLPGKDKTMTPMIPLAPIWRGFIYNSLIYTILWLVLLLLPQFIRTRIRIVRNQCEICGYDLRGKDHTHCPECGEKIAH